MKSKNRLPDAVIVKRSGYFVRAAHGQPIKIGETKGEALAAISADPGLLNVEKTDDEILAERIKRTRYNLFNSMRARARNKGLCSLSKTEFDHLWNASGGSCQLTGIVFRYEKDDGKVKSPWSPSIDRIDSSKGYSPENCRLVCTIDNLSLNEWGDEIFFEMIEAAARRVRAR